MALRSSLQRIQLRQKASRSLYRYCAAASPPGSAACGDGQHARCPLTLPTKICHPDAAVVSVTQCIETNSSTRFSHSPRSARPMLHAHGDAAPLPSEKLPGQRGSSRHTGDERRAQPAPSQSTSTWPPDQRWFAEKRKKLQLQVPMLADKGLAVNYQRDGVFKSAPSARIGRRQGSFATARGSNHAPAGDDRTRKRHREHGIVHPARSAAAQSGMRPRYRRDAAAHPRPRKRWVHSSGWRWS